MTIKYFALGLSVLMMTFSEGISKITSSDQWEVIQQADPQQKVQFVIGLNHFVDHSEFVKRNTPGHPSYHDGAFMTHHEARQLATRNMEPCRQLVKQFAQSHDLQIQSISKYDEYYEITATVTQVETLFGSRMYVHSNGQMSITRLASNHTRLARDLPGDVQACISHWGRVWDFPKTKQQLHVQRDTRLASARALRQLSSTTCPPQTICPATLQAMYGLPNMAGTTPPSNIKQMVFEYAQSLTQDGELVSSVYSPSDLQEYLQIFGLDDNIFATINGGEGSCITNPDGCGEPNLDTQMLLGTNTMNTPTSQNLYLNFSDSTDFVTTLANMDWNGVAVLSISFGGSESESDIHDCNELKSLGDQGVSIFVSAGDDGASSGCNSTETCVYEPQSYASCPYVTAVGGTYGFAQGQEVGATSQNNQCAITSGGGFSTIFNSTLYDLSWQAEATEAFAQTMSQRIGGLLSVENNLAGVGRGYPDISAVGCNFYMIQGGNASTDTCGTSGSAPIMAGIVSMIAMRHGRTFGWINPSLYQNQDIFYDVVEGANYCGLSDCYVGPNNTVYGYFAQPGWDAVSGVGTLGKSGAFDALEQVLLKSSGSATMQPSAASSHVVTLIGWIIGFSHIYFKL